MFGDGQRKREEIKKKIELRPFPNKSRDLLDKEDGLGKSGRRFYQVISLIGWNFVNRGVGHWGLIDHNEEEQKVTLYGRADSDCRVDIDKGSFESISVMFAFAKCFIDITGGGAVTLTPPSGGAFIMFSNPGLNQEERDWVMEEFKQLKNHWNDEEARARKEGVID